MAVTATELETTRRTHDRLSWSAIFGGTFVAVGCMLFLHVLGLAIGLTAVDTNPSGAGVWLAVWSLIVPIVSLGIGGLVAGWYCGFTEKFTRTVHGAVVWGLGLLIHTALLWVALSTILGGALGVGRTVMTTAGQAAGAISPANIGQIGQTLGISAQDLLAPINQQRQQQGQEPLSAQNLQQALQGALNTALQQGTFNQEIFVNSLVENTAMDRQTAQQLANQVTGQVGGIASGIVTAADAALDTLAWYTWFAALSILLSLAAAAGAAAAKRPAPVRHDRTHRREVHTGRRGEVHP